VSFARYASIGYGGRSRNTFNIQHLEDLKKCHTEIVRMISSLNTTHCRELVYGYSETNEIPHEFNHKVKMSKM
jgi:hypothetical protein